MVSSLMNSGNTFKTAVRDLSFSMTGGFELRLRRDDNTRDGNKSSSTIWTKVLFTQPHRKIQHRQQPLFCTAVFPKLRRKRNKTVKRSKRKALNLYFSEWWKKNKSSKTITQKEGTWKQQQTIKKQKKRPRSLERVQVKHSYRLTLLSHVPTYTVVVL